MRALPRTAVTVLAALALSCDPGPPPPRSPAAASARALVRPYVARNALRQPTARGATGGVVPGPSAVILSHRAEDGTMRVGCVDSEDGAEDLVRAVEDTR